MIENKENKENKVKFKKQATSWYCIQKVEKGYIVLSKRPNAQPEKLDGKYVCVSHVEAYRAICAAILKEVAEWD